MSKISPNMIKNICSNKNVTNMFIDFDTYKDYFSEGTKEEYLKEIKNYIYDTFHKKLNSGNFIMEKDFISCSIKLFDMFFITEENILNEKLFHYLGKYKDLINMSVERKVGPCSIENKDLRNQALDVANTQLIEIDKAFKDTKYKESLMYKLSTFDKYLPFEKMDKQDFKELNELLASSGLPIPNKYVDLYFSNAITGKHKLTFLAVETALSSMIHNFASSKKAHCYFEAKQIDIDAGGIYYDNIIRISDSVIVSFVKNPVIYKENLFSIFFHELRHFAQDQGYKGNRKFSYSEIRMLKDDLLFNVLNKTYGKENYLNLSYELDAREQARISTIRYLRKLGDPIQYRGLHERTLDKQMHDTDIRIIDSKMVKVDHLFDEFISNIKSISEGDFHIDIFEEYPVLNLMYDRNCRRYTTLELFKKREELKKQQFLEHSQEREIDIHNINEILYNQDLSFVNLVADYKELLTDTTLIMDEEEKKVYLEKYLYERINDKSTKEFKILSFYVGTILKRNLKEVKDSVVHTIKNGREMILSLNELFKQAGIKTNDAMFVKNHKTTKK